MKDQKDILDVLQQKGLLTEEEANSIRTEMERSFPEYFTGADFNKLSGEQKTGFIEKLHEYVIGKVKAKRENEGHTILTCERAEEYLYYKINELLMGEQLSKYPGSVDSISQKFNRDRKQQVQ